MKPYYIKQMKYHFIFEIDLFPPGYTFKYTILYFYSDKEEKPSD